MVSGWCYRARPLGPEHQPTGRKRGRATTPPPEPRARPLEPEQPARVRLRASAATPLPQPSAPVHPPPPPEDDERGENDEQEEEETMEDAEEEAGSGAQREGEEEEEATAEAEEEREDEAEEKNSSGGQRDEEEEEEAEGSSSGSEYSEEERERTDRDMEDDDWDMVVQMAWSVLLLPELSRDYGGAVNCLKAMSPPRLFQCLSREQRRTLREATEGFFTDSGASEHGKREGLRAKTKQELEEAWRELFHRRRRVQLDDTLPIREERQKAAIYTRWMDEWLTLNLREGQRSRPRAKHTSVFNA